MPKTTEGKKSKFKNDRVCRTCLQSENLAPIFARTEQHERYTLALFLTTGLQIELDDGLPQTICWECTERVNSALVFRSCSHRAEVQLLRLGHRRGRHLRRRRTLGCDDGENHVLNPRRIRKDLRAEVDLKPAEERDALIARTAPTVDARLSDNECASETVREFVAAASESKLYEAFRRRYSDDESNLSPGYISDQNYIVKSGVPRRRPSAPRRPARGPGERRAALLSLVDGPLDPRGPVRCRLCKKTVSRWSSFRTHSKLHLGFDFLCEYCGKSFISITQLRRHSKSKHGEARTICCQRCGYKALDKRQLVLHERREHTGERPFVCDACGASYFSRRCLIQHIENHSTARTIQCDKCPSMFKSRRHLARHTYTCHTSKAYNYRCHVCQQLYKKLKYVRHHMSKMHGLSTQQQGPIAKIRL